MMSPPERVLLTVLSSLFVGGAGFVFYRHPGFFAEMNRRLGRKMFATPRFIALLRVVGIVEMALAGFAILSLFFFNE